MNAITAGFRRLPLLLPVLTACTVNHSINMAPHPEALARYVATHHPPALLVTDSTGRSTWVYGPAFHGDSLRGTLDRAPPFQNVAIPVGNVRSVAAQRFSPGRTLGLVGGILAAVGAVALMAPPPDY